MKYGFDKRSQWFRRLDILEEKLLYTDDLIHNFESKCIKYRLNITDRCCNSSCYTEDIKLIYSLLTCYKFTLHQIVEVDSGGKVINKELTEEKTRICINKLSCCIKRSINAGRGGGCVAKLNCLWKKSSVTKFCNWITANWIKILLVVYNYIHSLHRQI